MRIAEGTLTDDIQVGHWHDAEAATGCTVVLLPEGATGGVDLRGGAASTRAADSLSPTGFVTTVDALVITGGSAFGLDCVGGVMKWLEERGRGFVAGGVPVPIVPGAVIFDLWVGDAGARPGFQEGYSACEAAGSESPQGNIGAGMGATVGKYLGRGQAMKGGLGICTIGSEDGVEVSAVVVVNAYGDVVDPQSGEVLAGVRDPSSGTPKGPGCAFLDARHTAGFTGGNTTVAVVVTNAALGKPQVCRVCTMAHDGIARAVSPCHSRVDGDVVFGAALGRTECDVDVVGFMAAVAVERAILAGVRAAEGLTGVPAWRDLKR